MRKMIIIKKVILIIYFILTYSDIPAQDPNAVKYFPLSKGNVYVYNHSSYVIGIGSNFNIKRYEIMADTLLNGRKYFSVNLPNVGGWLRVDSLTGSIHRYDTTGCTGYDQEVFVDSLGMMEDTIVPTSECIYTFKFNVTNPVNLFGISCASKSFQRWYLYPTFVRYYAENFGLYRVSTSHPYGNESWILKGCIINGVVYGDTTLTSIQQLGNSIPYNFSLHQNYPNPFNPSTKIKFDIPKGSLVKLKVYDILGREVAELVNEKLNAGEYEYEWNGAGLTSGVYFYRLQAGEFVETKRMVLVK